MTGTVQYWYPLLITAPVLLGAEFVLPLLTIKLVRLVAYALRQSVVVGITEPVIPHEVKSAAVLNGPIGFESIGVEPTAFVAVTRAKTYSLSAR